MKKIYVQFADYANYAANFPWLQTVKKTGGCELLIYLKAEKYLYPAEMVNEDIFNVLLNAYGEANVKIVEDVPATPIEPSAPTAPAGANSDNSEVPAKEPESTIATDEPVETSKAEEPVTEAIEKVTPAETPKVEESKSEIKSKTTKKSSKEEKIVVTPEEIEEKRKLYPMPEIGSPLEVFKANWNAEIKAVKKSAEAQLDKLSEAERAQATGFLDYMSSIVMEFVEFKFRDNETIKAPWHNKLYAFIEAKAKDLPRIGGGVAIYGDEKTHTGVLYDWINEYFESDVNGDDFFKSLVIKDKKEEQAKIKKAEEEKKKTEKEKKAKEKKILEAAKDLARKEISESEDFKAADTKKQNKMVLDLAKKKYLEKAAGIVEEANEKEKKENEEKANSIKAKIEEMNKPKTEEAEEKTEEEETASDDDGFVPVTEKDDIPFAKQSDGQLAFV